MAKLILRVVSSTKQVQDINLAGLMALPVEMGATYTLLDGTTQTPVKDLLLKKGGDTLVVQVEDEAVARIEYFYADGQEANLRCQR